MIAREKTSETDVGISYLNHKDAEGKNALHPLKPNRTAEAQRTLREDR